MPTYVKPNSGQRRTLLVLVLLLGVLILIWLGGKYLHQQPQASVNWYPAAANCQLPETACSTTFMHGKKLRLTLLLDEPQPLEPLPLQVELQGFSAAELAALSLEVDLQGRDMYMGYNRTPMNYQGFGLYNATPRLSICTEESMVWRLSLLLTDNTSGQTLGTYFDFEVRR